MTSPKQQKEHLSTSNEEVSLKDLFNAIKSCATKDDMSDIKNEIRASKMETNKKIEHINERIDTVASTSDSNANKIEILEAHIDNLKQDQLKNNICVSGVPCELIKDNNTNNIIIKIAKTLDIELTQLQFSSHTIANKKLIIVHMHDINTKTLLLNKIRAKKSLMVEEVFDVQSNSQIYLNEQLIPLFSRIFQLARKAKKDNLLASVSSNGGRIRIRKNTDDSPITITSEKQLNSLIYPETDIDPNNMAQQANTSKNNSQTPANARENTAAHTKNNNRYQNTQKNNNTGKPPFTRSAKRQHENNNTNLHNKKPRHDRATALP